MQDADHCRNAHVLRAVRALESAETGGVVLVGEPGAGKTFTIRKILGCLDDQFCVTTLHASPFFSTTPFGVLGPLLADIDDAIFSSALLVSRLVARALQPDDPRHRPLLVVDDAQHLDDQSAAVLAQLSQGTHGVVVLAATTDVARLGPELMSLWQDGSLTRVDLPLFDLTDAATALAEEFGHRFATSAVVTLWQATAGNPSYLSALTRQQLSAGTIRLLDGVWVRTAKDLDYSGVARDLIKGRLMRLDAGQREAVELLALADGVTLPILMRLVPPDHIDDVEELGLVSVDLDHGRVVRIANPMVFAVVRDLIPPGRGCGLLSRLIDAGEAPWQDPHRNLAYAEWSLTCGTAIPPDHLLGAARTANDDGDGARALRLLAAATGGDDLAHVVEAVRALVMTGQFAEAHRRLDAVPSTVDGTTPAPLADWVRVMTSKAGVLARMGDSKRARAVLHDLHEVLDRAGAAGAETHELSWWADLAAADVANWTGDFAGAIRLLEDLTVRATLNDHAACLTSAMLAEAYAVTGRHRQARTKASEATASLLDVTVDVGHRALNHLVKSHVVAGTIADLDEVVAVAERRREYRWQNLADVGRGVVHLQACRPREALTSLVPAVEYLRAGRDEFGLLELTEEAARCARALTSEGTTPSEDPASTGPAGPWLNRGLASWFRDGAVTAGTDLAVSLARRADDVATSAPALALRFVLLAFRHDPAVAVNQLDRIGSSVEGFLGETALSWASAFKRGDGGSMLSLCHTVQQAGHDALARDIAVCALECATAENDRNVIRMAQRAVRSLNPVAEGHRSGARSEFVLFALTAREREVAVKAAAGLTNRRIAEQMHVSVRTVEGHLYQVYTKLHVSSRAGLREALAVKTR